MAQLKQNAGSFGSLLPLNPLLTIIISTTLMTVVNSITVYQLDIFANFKTTPAILLAANIVLFSMVLISVRKMMHRPEPTGEKKEIMQLKVCETDGLDSFGELATGIAHEINNPVAIMIEEAGWIEDLLAEEEFKDGKNLAEFKRALEQIRTQGGRCKEITQKLLSFARKTDSTVQEVAINEMIQEVVALSAQKARYSNVIFDAHLQDNLPSLWVSQAELQQVMLNLINNALDAMEKTGGTLRISSRMDQNDTTLGDHVTLEIADSGPGIPPGNMNRIFDPFFTTKPVGKGTGLGLSICYGIIKKMGGNIEVRSVFDEGTTFTVKIPLLKREKTEGR